MAAQWRGQPASSLKSAASENNGGGGGNGNMAAAYQRVAERPQCNVRGNISCTAYISNTNRG